MTALAEPRGNAASVEDGQSGPKVPAFWAWPSSGELAIFAAAQRWLDDGNPPGDFTRSGWPMSLNGERTLLASRWTEHGAEDAERNRAHSTRRNKVR
jgi:hypothetical protein